MTTITITATLTSKVGSSGGSPPAPVPPTDITAPIISGSNVVGQLLTTTDGIWTGTEPIAYTYQWKRNGSDIVGATSSTYTLVQADGGNNISCTVTATNVAGSASKDSSNSLLIQLLLDAYPNAATAYSVRKLRTLYTGNCIRVRRSSDNVEQNIGFVNNELDTASLLSFVGANDGFVTTWFDQSGGASNLTQTTAANQPRIVSSGTIEVNANGKPAVRFIDTSTSVIQATMNTPLWYAATVTYIGVFSVYQLNNLTYSNYIQGSSPNGSRGFHILHTNTGQPRVITYRTASTTGTGTALNSNQVYLRYDTANRVNIQTYINGSSTPNINVADTNTNFGAVTNVVNGSNSSATVTSDTPISEYIGYITDQTANKTGIETNIKIYFGI
jgi:hypothetical protein